MSQSGLVKLFEPAIEWMAFRYQRAVGNELRKYGLRYDDLLCQAYSLVSSPTALAALRTE